MSLFFADGKVEPRKNDKYQRFYQRTKKKDKMEVCDDFSMINGAPGMVPKTLKELDQ